MSGFERKRLPLGVFNIQPFSAEVIDVSILGILRTMGVEMVTGKYFAAERINPLELIERPDVSLLVEEIFNNYKPSGKKIMLILPCSAQKPYGESRSQRLYWEAAREVVKQEDVLERATLSGVYGIVPASFEKRVMDYDFNLNRSCFTRGKHYE